MERPSITISDFETKQTTTRLLTDEEYAEFLSAKEKWELYIQQNTQDTP